MKAKPSLMTAFIVILMDMIGFGIMIPIMAYYSLQLGAGPEVATLCMALYAAGMLISTPILGRISDYFGRRPVLILSMIGAIIGYLLLGFATAIWMVALSRFFSGLMAGNIAAAQAYITDITSEEDRAKGMGIIGAAFGLGFIIGPAIGSLLAGEDFEQINFWLPAMFSASMSGLALMAILLFLPESLSQEQRNRLRKQARVSQLQAFKAVSVQPMIFTLLVACLVYNIAAGLVEAIFPLWVDVYSIVKGPKDLVPFFLAAGLTLVVIQAGMIGPLAKRFGEIKLLFAGCTGFALAMLGLIAAGNAQSYYGVMLALACQSGSAAFIMTPLQSLVSKCALDTERGMVMGVYSSSGTLGRMLGTILTGAIFANIHTNSPYVGGTICMLILMMFILSIAKRTMRLQQA